MRISVIKIDSGRFCMHESCKKDPQYITPKGRIRKGTTVAVLSHKVNSAYNAEAHFYYCRTCIDQLLFDCRMKLDSKLWIFS